MIYPSYLQIETVAGICSTSCIMCPIQDSPRKEIMSNNTFEGVLNAFLPHLDRLRFTSLVGLGETLLDRDVANKVALAKKLGFPSVGVYTNATHLNKEMSHRLLESGLDTLALSLDGATKETHEAIRPRADFDLIVANILRFVELRKKYGHTKVVIKMVRQESNKHEWDDYFDFWKRKLDASFGDLIGYLDVHNYAGNVDEEHNKSLLPLAGQKASLLCRQLFEIIFVRSNTQVGLCCGDVLEWFNMGSVLEIDPLTIYSNETFVRYRERMRAGRINELKYCNTCSSTISDSQKQYFPPESA